MKEELSIAALFVSCFVCGVLGDGAAVATAAKSQIVPANRYSWGGGNKYGPSLGIKMTIDPYCDDSAVRGFDCSGLSLYSIYQGTGILLTHKASSQYADTRGTKIAVANALPGDLFFYSSTGNAADIYHVTVAVGNNKMAEATSHYANCTGKPPAINTVRTTNRMPYAVRFWTVDQSSAGATSGARGASGGTPGTITPSSFVASSAAALSPVYFLAALFFFCF